MMKTGEKQTQRNTENLTYEQYEPHQITGSEPRVNVLVQGVSQ